MIAGLCAQLVHSPAFAAWDPVFVDNFDGSSLTTEKWVRGQENLVRQLQSYNDANISVSGGNLSLGISDQPYYGRPYTAGGITSQGLFAQRFGYFEMHAKMPKGTGLWPAFWLMPVSGRWTIELDILEYEGNVPNEAFYSMHYDWAAQTQNTLIVDHGFDLSQSFNTYAMLWTPTVIQWLFNGVVVHEITDQATVDQADRKMYLLLNTALASQHQGWIHSADETTDFNAEFLVDYVRVYKEDPNGQYATIPLPTDSVADTIADPPYDNTGVSVESIGGGTAPIMRTPGYIGDTIRLESHAPNVSGKIWISLHSSDNFQPDGNYSTQLQQIFDWQLNMNGVGSTLDLTYEFDQVLIDSPGLYHVDIVIRDGVEPWSNRAAGRYKSFQYLDSTVPTDAVYFDGFFRSMNVSALDCETIEVDLSLQLQELVMSPFVVLNYQILDVSSGAVLLDTDVNEEHTEIGLVQLAEQFQLLLQPGSQYQLVASAYDSTKANVIASEQQTFQAPASCASCSSGSALIGNIVWDDTDGDGRYEPGKGETLVSGVTMNLYDGSSNFIRSKVTSGAGKYAFGKLCAGDYIVEVVPPAGMVTTVQDAAPEGVDSDAGQTGFTDVITLSPGQKNYSVDFGMVPSGGTTCSGTSLIANAVWHDLDMDGKYEPGLGEPLVTGVVVNLLDSAGNFIRSKTTSATGKYAFGKLCAGDYQVQIEPPAGFQLTLQYAAAEGVDSDADASGYTGVITLNTGEKRYSVDFGLHQ